MRLLKTQFFFSNLTFKGRKSKAYKSSPCFWYKTIESSTKAHETENWIQFFLKFDKIFSQNAYISILNTPPSPQVSIRKHFATPTPLKNAYVI